MKALRVVTRSERLDGITGHRGRRRHVGERAAVWPPELELPVAEARDLVALLVHRPVMPATEHGKVRERGCAAVGPMAEMMALSEA
jgi:hypothetical protein